MQRTHEHTQRRSWAHEEIITIDVTRILIYKDTSSTHDRLADDFTMALEWFPYPVSPLLTTPPQKRDHTRLIVIASWRVSSSFNGCYGFNMLASKPKTITKFEWGDTACDQEVNWCRFCPLIIMQISHDPSELLSSSSTMSGTGTPTSDKAISCRSRNQTSTVINPIESIYDTTNRTIPSSDKASSTSSLSPLVVVSGMENKLGPIARLFSSSQRTLSRHSASDGQTVNEEATRTGIRWRKTHSAVVHPYISRTRETLQQTQKRQACREHSLYSTGKESRQSPLPVNNVIRVAGWSRSQSKGNLKQLVYRRIEASAGEKPDLNCSRKTPGSVTNTAISRNSAIVSRQRKTAVYSRDFPVTSIAGDTSCCGPTASQFSNVDNLIKLYATMLSERSADLSAPKMRAKSEG